MAPKVDSSSKKNEILEAYNELLAQVQETKHVSQPDERRQQEEIETITRAANVTNENIITTIMDLKLSLNKELDALENKMVSEQRRLSDIQSAIRLESQNLHDLYGINKNADSLAALLLAQKEHQKKFELDTTEKRAQWEKEQQECRQQAEEKYENAKKLHLREEEEHDYSLRLARKKDKDLYEARKLALENELEERKNSFNKEVAEREASINAHEDEFKSLQDQVNAFPQKLERAVKEMEKTTRESIELFYKHQIDLTNKEVEGERRLNQQIILSLQEKIKEQEENIKLLNQKTTESGKQVQSIALKALEGASNLRFSGSYTEDGKKTSSVNV